MTQAFEEVHRHAEADRDLHRPGWQADEDDHANPSDGPCAGYVYRPAEWPGLKKAVKASKG